MGKTWLPLWELEIKHRISEADEIDKLLLSGWEPFAAYGERIYFKRTLINVAVETQ